MTNKISPEARKLLDQAMMGQQDIDYPDYKPTNDWPIGQRDVMIAGIENSRTHQYTLAALQAALDRIVELELQSDYLADEVDELTE